MRISKTTRTILFGALVIALAAGATACGKAAEKLSEKGAEKMAEKAIEADSGGKADVDLDKGTYKLETEDGSFEVGAEMPKDWPEDIPLPNGFKPDGGMNMSSKDQVMITLSGATKKSVDEAADFYIDELSDWEKASENEMTADGEKLRTLQFTNGDRTLLVSASDASGSDTMLSFTYQVGPAE